MANAAGERDPDQPAVGIDLGTTNSVVATIDQHGRPVCLPNGEGDVLTPSVVYFEAEGPAIVGKEALKAGRMDAANMLVAVKRDMGEDAVGQSVRGKKLPPAAVSGVILHRLKEDAALRVGDFDRAVVTVPAYFNEPRRKATADAARMAGFAEVELLNEPTAAALAFGYELGAFTDGGELAARDTRTPGQFHVLVYDLGGGTFDVTLMRIQDRSFQALVCDGDVRLGGRDWDARLVRHALDEFTEEFDQDLSGDVDALAQLEAGAEELKRSLTQREKATLRFQHGPHKLVREVTRSQLAEMTADLLGRTRMTCELALMEAAMTWDRLDAILLVGGSSRMPQVAHMLEELSGIVPTRTVNPDEAVAKGAALYARMRWDAGADVTDQVGRIFRMAKVTDVNSHSLGIVGRDRKTGERRVVPIIPRNTPIPHSNSRGFRTRREGQGQIYIEIVEGESADPAHCATIGECRLTDLPPGLPAGWPVTVSFAYRRDGRIFVEAQVKDAEPFHVEIDRRRQIDDAEAEEWANELIAADDIADVSSVPPSKVTIAKVRPKQATRRRED